ncbi:hypothetical protein CIT292_08157 [Citrobacter youngae ATCC 29220]|uniref:Uncharacterized protein n=1 Tax=Citrobacter youngae ATCC 29220 TaxID=500640 RepID=D4BCF1_9ENTR|nr:hypothetical protein CIT292_08157 [Citrobacter youngae ATCC 29220]
MLDKENAAKLGRAQGVWGTKKKKLNDDYRMMKKDYVMNVFIDESTILWRFY